MAIETGYTVNLELISMNLSSIRRALCILVLSAITAGCDQRPPVKNIQQGATEELNPTANQIDYATKRSNIGLEVSTTTENEIRSLMSACKSAILKLAKSKNKSAFEVYLVDEYSADSYQAIAYTSGGHLLSEARRVEQFIKARDMGSPSLALSLEKQLAYTVIHTRDSFSGINKEAVNYGCLLEPGLKVLPYRKE